MLWPSWHAPDVIYDASTVLYVPTYGEPSLVCVKDDINEHKEMLALVSGIHSQHDVCSISFSYNRSTYTCIFYDVFYDEGEMNSIAQEMMYGIVEHNDIKGPFIMYRMATEECLGVPQSAWKPKECPYNVHSEEPLEVLLNQWRGTIFLAR